MDFLRHHKNRSTGKRTQKTDGLIDNSSLEKDEQYIFSFKVDFFKEQGKVKEKEGQFFFINFKKRKFKFWDFFGNHFRDNLQIGMLNL